MLRHLQAKIMILILSYAFSVTALSQSNINEKCLITKAAFDVGSGSTKLKVAKVDRCQKKILKILLEEQRSVPYKESLTNGDHFSVSIMDRGKKALTDLKKAAIKQGAEVFEGVATSAFRKAKNGKDLVAKLNKALSLNLKIINQKEEATLGYLGASLHAKTKSYVVWDIGGGSMQMLSKSGSEFFGYEGQTASVSFKNRIIDMIQKKDLATTTSPNPISQRQLERAMAWIKVTIPGQIHPTLLKKLPLGEVLGIGSVHRYAIGGLLNKSSWTSKDLRAHVQKLVGKSDQELGGGPYVSTKVSNVILVLGFMEALSIQKMTALKVNLTDGLLIK